MNDNYYKICEKILGKYTNYNNYEYQFLYLICYFNKGDLTDIELKKIVKILYKKIKKMKMYYTLYYVQILRKKYIQKIF